MKYSYISDKKQLAGFLGTLQRNKTQAVCMDFEGEFNLHCYGEKLCLIQVFDGQTSYVIDPFRIEKTELVKLFTSSVVKLFYSAGSDRKLVFRQYGARIKSLLDISDLVDVLGMRHSSLDALLEEMLSVKVEKKKSYQRFNWTIRPLPEEAIQYALSDVRYLFDLKDVLLKKTKEKDLVESLVYRLTRSDFDYEKKSMPGVKKKTRYLKLSPEEKKVFDNIFSIREDFAKKLDKPPNSVISNEQVFQIAEHMLEIDSIKFNQAVPVPYRKKLIHEISAALSSTAPE